MVSVAIVKIIESGLFLGVDATFILPFIFDTFDHRIGTRKGSSAAKKSVFRWIESESFFLNVKVLRQIFLLSGKNIL